MIILVRSLHGSKLYGLDGPLSDTDYKSVFIPPIRDCIFLRAARNMQEKTGDGADKQEHEAFALQEFLTLAARGEDCAISMIHAATHQIVVNPDPIGHIWTIIRENQSRFYTRRMVGSLGYAKSQAVRYGMRADRMAAVERVIAALQLAADRGVARLFQCWDDLPDGEHILRTTSLNNRDGLDKRIYEVAGKGLPATVSPQYALEILVRLRDAYGDRVKAAKSMGGRDFKALSHSFRVGYQLLHIYQDGGFTYPLPESDFLRAVKESRLNYLDDKLDERLNELITTVEGLAEKSAYPERVDQAWLDAIVLDAYAKVYDIAA